MAAAALLLFLLYCLSDASLDRRFSELKRCTDDECSMLLVRGKAVDDFSGPDCRFLSFKKSETIYVYYKLSGRRTDIWAGSVGNRFGYFPKDLLAVNHVYTEKELEVPAEETDFVCFDTGFDGFDDYNIDSLLGPSYLMQESEKRDEFDPTERAVEHSEASEEPSTEDGAVDGHDGAHDADLVQSASLTQELVIAEAVEQNVVGAPDPSETHEGEKGEIAGEREDEPKDVDDEPIQDDPHDDPGAERGFTSRGFQIPELKTTLGTTFEAVATDDEDTRKVTPYYEEEGEELMDDNVNLDVPTATPLLLSSDESTSALETDPLDEGGLQQTPEDDEDDDEDKDDDDLEMPTSETRNMLSSLGDAVFAIVSGGKQTADDLNSEEEEEDDDDDDENMEEMTPEKTLTTNEANEDLNRELEDEEPAAGDSPLLSEGQNDTDDDSERLLFDYDDDDDDDDGKNNSDWVEQTTDPEKTPTLSVGDRVDFDMDDSTPHQYKDKTPDEPAAQKVSEPPEPSDEQDDDDYRDDAHLQDGDTQKVTRLKEVETSTGHDESSAVDAKENGKSENSKSTDGHEKEGDDGSFERRLGRAVPETEKTERRDVDRDSPADEEPSSKDEETQGEGVELLEDENAVLSTESHMPSSVGDALIPELEYSDGVLRLILLRDHFKEEDMERLRRFLSLRNLLKVEAMFSDLDLELQAARLSDMNTAEDIEKSLDGILEASENLILDEIEKMLDGRDIKHGDAQQTDTGVFDDEAELLDEFQELAFKLRQKYSAASDSTPLQTEGIPVLDQDDHTPSVGEDRAEIPPAVVEVQDHIVVFEEEEEEGQMKNDSATVEEEEAHIRAYVDDARERRDLGVTVDGGHFNNNKDNQPSYGAAEDIQKSPPAVLDKPFDLGLGVEVEHSSSGSLDSVEPTADFNEEEPGLFSSGMSYYILCILATVKTKMTDWVVVIISLLPEEWKPGETLLGCPWQAVVATALVGVVSVTHFFWKTVLAVKKKEYLVTEKGLHNQILALNKEKSNAVLKTSELQTRIDELREKQKQSDETASCALKRNCDLERKVLDSEGKNKRLAEKVRSYRDLLEDGKAKMETNDARMEKLVKANEKLQLSRQKTEKTLAETTVLLDEAKLRDDARNIQHKCLQRDHAALKEENKTLKVTMKGWEEKHQNLNQQIKVYQKSQKELEDSVAFKDHNVEVLSELLADLDACDMQKGDAKVLANGEVLNDKKTMIKNHIKQMMDVARVKTTLSVVEEERDRYMTKLLHVEKARKALEEQHQQLEHAISTLKSEKSHVQNQFQILQQKNEIMTEMYQQKEHALQQKLTKEELERRSRETLLSEVGGKAVETESHVKVLRQRINEMDEQMKKTEVAYKEQIKEQENKTHTNWVNARNAERALNQEKVETSKLREKLAVLSSRLNEHRAHLFRPNPGQTLAPRQAGDSFGASPVSGGAPSPPLMIEGPRRPPSAPLGRRIDPYGPRPTSDPHGRYLDNKHNSGIDAAAPRTSSPLTTDDPAAERLAIVDSPITAHGSPHGPHEAQQGPRGRLPPPGPYRPPPRPGPHGPLYPLPPGMMGPPPPHHHRPMPPANGHPGVPPYAPMGGEFGARPSNGHPLWPGADPRGPPPPHFRPPPPHHFGAMPPPPHGLRGPMGPRAPFPADMRFPGPGYPPVGPAFLPGGGGGGPPRPPPHGDAFTHPPPDAHRPPTGGGPGQGHPDAGTKQETTPQDSGQLTNTMAEP